MELIWTIFHPWLQSIKTPQFKKLSIRLIMTEISTNSKVMKNLHIILGFLMIQSLCKHYFRDTWNKFQRKIQKWRDKYHKKPNNSLDQNNLTSNFNSSSNSCKNKSKDWGKKIIKCKIPFKYPADNASKWRSISNISRFNTSNCLRKFNR